MGILPDIPQTLPQQQQQMANPMPVGQQPGGMPYQPF